MSYEQLYLRMKALEKERDELRAFIIAECMHCQYYDVTQAETYKEIEHVV